MRAVHWLLALQLLLIPAAFADYRDDLIAKVKQQVKEMEQEGPPLVARLNSDPQARPRLKELVDKITLKDPMNAKAGEWRALLNGRPAAPVKPENLEQQVAERPTNIPLVREAADKAFVAKDYAEASKLYHQLLGLDPGACDANSRLGLIAANGGDSARAKAFLAREPASCPLSDSTKKLREMYPPGK